MNAYASYQKTKIECASREDLMLQMYEGAISNLHRARGFRSNGQEVKAREHRLQVTDILVYLDNTLDMENGGQLAVDLDAIYCFMIRELSQSTLHDDFDRVKTVQGILESMHEGWKEAVAEYKLSKEPPQKIGATAAA